MSGSCFMVEYDREQRVARNPATGETHEFPWQFGHGAMWWGRYDHFGSEEEKARYRRERALFVCLPAAAAFCVDGPSYHYDEQTKRMVYGAGWTWTGEPPNISVTPSININNDEWHGFIANGVFTP